MSSKSLPKMLQSGPFSAMDAKRAGISRYQLRLLLASESIESIAHGIYRPTNLTFTDEELFRAASMRVGKPSAICLMSALAYHGLTDIIPKKIWIMVPNEKRTLFSDLRLFRARRPAWKIGIRNEDGFSITDLERTLVDALTHQRQLGGNVAMAALRQALKSRNTSTGKLLDMAKALSVIGRVKSYLQVLS